MGTVIPEEKPDFSYLENLLRGVKSIDLRPEQHSDVIPFKPIAMLVNESNFWDKAFEVLSEKPWDYGMKNAVAERFQMVYSRDPKDVCKLRPDVLLSNIHNKGRKEVQPVARACLTSYVKDNIEDLLNQGKTKEVKKIATLLFPEYRKLLKLLNDKEYDDMRGILGFSHSDYNRMVMEDRDVAHDFQYLLDVKKETFLMRFNTVVGGKPVVNHSLMVEYIKKQYDGLDEKDYPEMRYSIEEKVLGAFIKNQEDKIKDNDPDKDKEDDWELPYI